MWGWMYSLLLQWEYMEHEKGATLLKGCPFLDTFWFPWYGMSAVPLCYDRMYGRFGNAELFGGRSYGGTIFDHVHSQITGPFFHFLLHVRTS